MAESCKRCAISDPPCAQCGERRCREHRGDWVWTLWNDLFCSEECEHACDVKLGVEGVERR